MLIMFRRQPESEMTTSPLEMTGFAAAVIDALSSHICVTDRHGVIIAVNRAWRRFGEENSGSCRSDVGAHYLRVCHTSSGPGADEAHDFALGVRAVLMGESDLFQHEYPCHSPTESRWFLGRVTPLGVEQGGAVISHLNITDRKLTEFELAKLASTDPLTGLPNRRYFLEAASREVERVRRFGRLASVVMIDLDHFKTLNDTYGHAAGDEALRSVTRVCRLRDIDVFARWGGEEFVAILPGTDEEGAFIVAEKLRCAVSGARVEVGSNHIDVTASLGVAQVWAHDKAIEEALGRADDALYDAKKAGRNCVRRSTEVRFSDHSGAHQPPSAKVR
jgi:diguanylate cyclase (GGDEF)-like protein